jgi:small subunit ribosomal protein S8
MGKRLVDGISKIKNALMSKHSYVDLESNSLVYNVCGILKQEGYVKDVKKLEESGNKNMIRVVLKYMDESRKQPVIRTFKLVSRPSRRIYVNADDIKPVMNDLGVGIISTSKGVMTTAKAKELNVGGEYICEVF